MVIAKVNDDERVHNEIVFKRIGSGSPEIVFLSGHNTPLSNWNNVLSELMDERGTYFVYDRLGVGASDRANAPQHGQAIVERLALMLQKEGMTGPYVLVAHSLGGLYANLFARMHPALICGVVFVDAAHPDEADSQSEVKPPAPIAWLLRVVDRWFPPSFKQEPFSEFNNVAETVAQIRSSDAFPAIPITVITGTQKMPFVPTKAHAQHQSYQRRLVQLSPVATHIFADKSGHAPHVSEPALVAESIKRIAR